MKLMHLDNNFHITKTNNLTSLLKSKVIPIIVMGTLILAMPSCVQSQMSVNNSSGVTTNSQTSIETTKSNNDTIISEKNPTNSESTQVTIPTSEIVTVPETTTSPSENISVNPTPSENNQQESSLLNIKNFFFNSDGYKLSPELSNQLQSAIASVGGNSSFYVASLDGKISMGYNIDVPHYSACVVKAAYVLYCFKQIETGKVSLQDTIIYEEKHHHGGSGVIQNSPYGTPFIIEDIIKYTITVSDNDGYLMLMDKFPLDSYQAMLKELGCNSMLWHIDSENNNNNMFGSLTAQDMSKIWREIYRYSQTSKYGKQYFQTLLDAKYDYIENVLPQYNVAHKSGWIDGIFNDGGIVLSGEPYEIVVLSNNSQNFSKLVRVIGNVMTEHQAYVESQTKETSYVKTKKAR